MDGPLIETIYSCKGDSVVILSIDETNLIVQMKTTLKS